MACLLIVTTPLAGGLEGRIVPCFLKLCSVEDRTARGRVRCGEVLSSNWLSLVSRRAGRMRVRVTMENPASDTPRPVVLVVEDEFLIRADAIAMIANAGFDAVE